MNPLPAPGVGKNVPALVPVSLWELTRYFLWLGTVGFGGPLALAPDFPEWLRASALLAGEIAYLPPVWIEVR